MKLLDVPVIDIAPFLRGAPADKARVAEQVGRACRDIGFLVIQGHGVDPALSERMRAVSRAFFDLPLAEKARVARPAKDVARGYIALDEEIAGALARPGRLRQRPQREPDDRPGRSAAGRLCQRARRGPPLRAQPVARAPGRAARDLDRVLPDDGLAGGEPDAHLRARPRPARSLLRLRRSTSTSAGCASATTRHSTSRRQPGQIRAGAHSDYGSLTILATEDKPGGLQVCNAAGEWVDVPIVDDCLIVNIGDLLARWTNDTWVSTLHRVVNPPAGAGAESRRQSLVFFHNPNYDAVIESLVPDAPPKYPRTTSGEHLRQLFTATQNAAQDVAGAPYRG